MKNALAYLLVAFLWLLHWLPLPLLRAFGALLGHLFYVLGGERRNVVLTNLGLCFPRQSEAERKKLARAHVVAFSRAVIDRTLGFWASRERLQRIIRLSGIEHLKNADGRPIILLCPHFVGLDAVATRLSMELVACSVYSNQKSLVLNRLLYNGRTRFNPAIAFSRQEGMRRIVKALKDGYPFFYLPDMDFGPKESIFVPFFGVSAATIPGVSRLVRMTGARVVPVIARQVADGYEVQVMPPLEEIRGEDLEADTRRVNAFIESQVLRMPEQYFWLHKRFKTRPPGEQRFYK